MNPTALVTVVVTLGLGNPATHFRQVELPKPVKAAVCETSPAAQIQADPLVQSLERQHWRVVLWDCEKGQGT